MDLRGEKERKLGKRRRNALEDIDEEEEDYAPPRGQYGKCDPIAVRYAYLDAKVRDAALACSLPPESLPLLIPGTSRLATKVQSDVAGFGFVSDADGNFRAVPAPKTGDMVSRFVASIPNPAVFLYAWTTFIDLVVHGLGSPDDAKEAYTALLWYGKWVMEKSTTHTWESICRYHLRVCGKRCAGEFHTRMWYNKVDADATTELILLPAKPVGDGSRGGPTATDKRRRTAREKRDTSGEICFRWNNMGCKEPCKDKRLHVCEYCGKPHKKTAHPA